jgi:hypothetical protein
MGLAPGRRIVVELGEPDLLELAVAARFLELAVAATTEDAELVELEDPIDGVDEVPGPPAIELDAGAASAEPADADTVGVPGTASGADADAVPSA